MTFCLLGGSYTLADKVWSGKLSAIILLGGVFGAGGLGEASLNPPSEGAARGGVQICPLTPSVLFIIYNSYIIGCVFIT
jgi:hypothetical protein